MRKIFEDLRPFLHIIKPHSLILIHFPQDFFLPTPTVAGRNINSRVRLPAVGIASKWHVVPQVCKDSRSSWSKRRVLASEPATAPVFFPGVWQRSGEYVLDNKKKHAKFMGTWWFLLGIKDLIWFDGFPPRFRSRGASKARLVAKGTMPTAANVS